MSDHDALLDAICEQPDEDTPRLAFADWLDEHADSLPAPDAARSRAAFIRDDIARSRLDEFDPQRVWWERVEKQRREGERWANATLPDLPRGLAYGRDPLFRRGFPWAVRFATNARRLADPPAAALPLECVHYTLQSDAADHLSAAPWRGRLRAIEFEGSLRPAANWRRLLALDGLDRLERLGFWRRAIGAAQARDLIRSPLFARLAALTVTEAPVGAAVAEEFDRLGRCDLRELRLIAARASADVLAVVFASVPRLEALAAGGDQIGLPDKFRAFARPAVPPLRTLDMSEDAPKEAGLEALNASPLPASVRRLLLANCNLSTDRTRLLASGAWASLRALDLSRNPVGNGGAAALARSSHLAGLVALDLGFAQVGDEGVLALLESPLADGLAFLNLVGSPASEETKELLVGRMGDRVRV